MSEKLYIGQALRRFEDQRFLTGRGTFTDDINMPGQTYGLVVRSPYAHAQIKKIDASRALALSGTLLVLTGEDAMREGLGALSTPTMPEDMGGPKAYRAPQPILAYPTTRYVGNPVAFVVAETLAQAKDAAELLTIDYEPLGAVATIGQAKAPGAPLVWEEAPGNLIYTLRVGDKAAVDAAFAKAAHVERFSATNNRITANPIEPRAALGVYDIAARRHTLYVTSQGPHHVKQTLAEILHIPECDLRVISRDVGGGFGMKRQCFPEECLVVWAAEKLRLPVKWTCERSEGLQADSHARDQMDKIELALDGAGKFIALRAEIEANVGAYIAFTGNTSPSNTLASLTGAYAISAIFGTCHVYFTHTTPVAVYRGAGMPEATYMIERVIESAARRLGIDPVELRRRNLIRQDMLPYRTVAVPQIYDSGAFGAVLEKALATADREGFAVRRNEAERRGRRRGLGFSQYVNRTNVFNERMGIRLEADGSVVILAGTFNHGQGHETSYAQLLADWLGVAPEKVRLIQGDTDTIAAGRGTFASRSMSVGGAALKKAADEVIEKGKKVAALLLEAAESDIEFVRGTYEVAGTDRRMALGAVARASHKAFGPLAKLGLMGLEGVGVEDATANFANGCHVCEVEVDPETGHIVIVRYIAIDDAGTIINPLLIEAQVHGAVAQGIGQALLEKVVHDSSGQLLSGSFMDYAMPRADSLPSFEVDFHAVPTNTNPIGVKGIGEAGAVAAPPALINAILDALAPLGVEDLEMPATPECVWRSIYRVVRC